MALLLTLALAAWVLAPVAQADSALGAISPPTISGTPQVGQTLSEGHGTWNFTPTWFAYQWEQCDGAGHGCVSINNALGQTYIVAASDLGHTLRVQETAITWRGFARAVSAATAIVSPPPIVRTSTATSLVSLEGSAVTNQLVTLVATVTSASVATPPSGTVTFANHGAPIAGCQNEPVLPTGQSVTVFCQTSFAAAVQQLTATFTPAPGALIAGSTSAPENLGIAPQSTTTALQLSSHTVHVGRGTTYTATVTPSALGPIDPTGAVEFLDQGQPIAACASRPVTWSGAASVATCTLTYLRAGQHLISARYVGDPSFAGSASPAPEQLDAVAGRIHPMLTWTFYFSPKYTKVLGLTVEHAPPGSRVLLTCTGRGCPFASRVAAVVARSARTPRRADLAPLFGRHHLKPGTVITVSIMRRGWIGKHYSFKVRRGHPPNLAISCQAPGLRPGVAC